MYRYLSIRFVTYCTYQCWRHTETQINWVMYFVIDDDALWLGNIMRNYISQNCKRQLFYTTTVLYDYNLSYMYYAKI